MTNEEILQALSAIRLALEGVSIQGKNNLANLYGSISALDNLLQKLQNPDEPLENK